MKRQEELFAKCTQNYSILKFHINANLKFTTTGKKMAIRLIRWLFSSPMLVEVRYHFLRQGMHCEEDTKEYRKSAVLQVL